MSPKTAWFDSPDGLLSELKQSHVPRPAPAIPGYEDFHELRRGGQGVVYRALQRSTRRTVAVKVLLDGAYASTSARRRFEREIDVVAGLRHPNIVRVFDGGADPDGRPYCVMEYIEGCALDELLSPPSPNSSAAAALPGRAARGGGAGERQRASSSAAALDELKSGARQIGRGIEPAAGLALDIPAALRLFLKVCDAVQYAHQRGVIHRDLKPSNIRVDPSGEPHVLDFGLAKAADDGDANQTQMTHSGHFLGSLPWASPEQASGQPDRIDIRSDVYALGVVLYQMLTGRFPYAVAGAMPDVLNNIRSAEPVRPRTLRREISEDLETIVLKCLAKEPARRYQSAGELAADLRHYLADEPISAKRDSAWYVTRKLLRRYRVAATVAVILLLAAGGFGATMTVMYRNTLAAKEAADAAKLTAQAEKEAADAARAIAQSQREAADAARRTALAEKDAADAATKTARAEANRATQTHRFLEQMLSSISPEEARSHDTTLLRKVLDEASSKLDSELADQPGAAAALHVTIGDTYSRLGLYKLGAQHFRTASELYERVSGPDDFGVIQSRVALAETLLRAEEVAEARPVLAEMAEKAPRVLGEEHELAIKVIHCQAQVVQKEGKYLEAEALYRRVYELKNRIEGPESDDTVTSMSDLALVIFELGRLEESEKLLREVLAARTRMLGEDHPQTLVSLNLLGLVCQERGNLSEAETLQTRGLELSRRILGTEHPDTLIVMSNLGTVKQGLGQFEPAVALLRECLDIRQRVLGVENPATLTAMNNLADIYRSMGRLADAEQLHRETLVIERRASGERSWDVAISLNNLALTLMQQDRFADAEPLYREAVEIARVELPAGNYQTSLLEGNYGKCLMKVGRYDEAEKLLLPAYETLSKTLGEKNGFVRGVRANLVALYEAWEKPDEAGKWRDGPP